MIHSKLIADFMKIKNKKKRLHTFLFDRICIYITQAYTANIIINVSLTLALCLL